MVDWEYSEYRICPECGYKNPEHMIVSGSQVSYRCKCGCRFTVSTKTLYRVDEILEHKSEEKVRDEDICNYCRYNRSDFEYITVDGRTADMWMEFACLKEDDMSDEDIELMNQNRCPYFERCTKEENDE